VIAGCRDKRTTPTASTDDVAVGARYSTLFVSSFNVFDEKTPHHYGERSRKNLNNSYPPFRNTNAHTYANAQGPVQRLCYMYLQLTWRGRGQTEVPQEEL
jgi:hypothetical protein